MPSTTWIALIFLNFMWAFNPTLAKIIVQDVGPLQTAWLRYFSAFCGYLLLRFALRTRKRSDKSPSTPLFLRPVTSSDIFSISMMGLTSCFVTPLTQMHGLAASSAASNAILIAMEPLFTFFFAWLLLNERLTRLHFLTFAIAITGFSLLSRLVLSSTSSAESALATSGDTLLAVAIAGEALFSVFAKKLSVRHSGPAIFGTALAIGATFLTGLVFATTGWSSLQNLTQRGSIALFLLGPLGTTLSYLFWIQVIQSGASMSSLVLTLFIQPVVGALAGMIFLGETLTATQGIGGLLILSAMAVQSIHDSRKEKKSWAIPLG